MDGLYDWGFSYPAFTSPATITPTSGSFAYETNGQYEGFTDSAYDLAMSWTTTTGGALIGGTGNAFFYLNISYDNAYISDPSLWVLDDEAYGSFNLTSLTQVPEPATWAMMMVGFGAMGVAMRSRRKQGAEAA